MKSKLLALILTVFLIPVAYALIGDVDGDTFPSPADVAAVNAAIITAGTDQDTTNTPTGPSLTDADVNNDGVVTDADAIVVQQEVLTPTLEVPADPVASSDSSGSSGGSSGGADNHPAVVTSTPTSPVEQVTQPTATSDSDNQGSTPTGSFISNLGTGNVIVSAIVISALLGLGFFVKKKYF